MSFFLFYHWFNLKKLLKFGSFVVNNEDFFKNRYSLNFFKSIVYSNVQQVLERKGYRSEGIDPNFDHSGLGTFLIYMNNKTLISFSSS